MKEGDKMINTGDTAFILISSALVFFMTPGLAFFYGGFVRRKNVLSTIMSSYSSIALASILWVLIGYSLTFGSDVGGIIGSLNFIGLKDVGSNINPAYASTIPHLLFAVFQMMFAIITPALITGALVERMKFGALLLFIGLWSIVVYYPLAHMVWGVGGFLKNIGAVDFAGGNVVHISAGVSALVASLMLGKRKGYGMSSYTPHNVPFVLLGAGLLWFGWFGFNAGSALGANGLAVHAFITTNTAGATGMLMWMLIEKLKTGKSTALGAATGAVIGLAAVTQGAGFVPIWASIVIGGLASPIGFFAITVIKNRFGYDDALDVFGCHGIGGIWGGIATGIFAQKSINPTALRWNGLIFGDVKLFVAQLISVVVAVLIAIVGTLVCMSIVKLFMKIRVSDRDEQIGLDISQHGESAYPSFTGLD
jgi:ammonium transporter, Amt family